MWFPLGNEVLPSSACELYQLQLPYLMVWKKRNIYPGLVPKILKHWEIREKYLYLEGNI